MNHKISWLKVGILGLLLIAPAGVVSPAVPPVPENPTPPPEAALSTDIAPAAVLAAMKRVADWQLAHPGKHGAKDWTQGAFYAGVMALAPIAGDLRYDQAMLEMGRKNHWQPGPRLYHADDQCVTQTYLELYLEHHDPRMLEPTKQRFDAILAAPKNPDFTRSRSSDVWSWCDALFMAPPAWARMAAATGDPKYLDFMDRNWWATSNYLYDKKERLFYRDRGFFPKREANGKKVFWSRGNGWVMAGLVRVLQYMPASYPDRSRYTDLFKKIASRIRSLQSSDHLWRPSLLDPGSYPSPETSGSGFFIYALAWGINQGLLDRRSYEPAVRRAWQSLVQCVSPDGRVGFVQPVGAAPAHVKATDTEAYGTGAFLLAGSEVYHLAH